MVNYYQVNVTVNLMDVSEDILDSDYLDLS